MPASPHIFLFDARPDLADALEQRLNARGLSWERRPLTGTPDVESPATPGGLAVVIAPPEPGAASADVQGLLDRLAAGHVSTLVCGAQAASDQQEAFVEWLGPDATLDEIVGKIGTLAHYAPLVSSLERELAHLHRLGEQLNHYFTEIDQEMRLAGRLQRDFLPRQLPSLPPYSFHAVYRPASWVSGDMYDVFRIDESRVGMFVADAMGHGVSAGLLTMFFRHALRPQRIDASAASVGSPRAALRELHHALLRQKLPHCHFVTAIYAVLDTSRGVVRLARGGHPYALLVCADRKVTELHSEGGLLGLADIDDQFEEIEVALKPGEKLVLYTDGVEDYLMQPRTPGAAAAGRSPLRRPIAELCRRPAAELVAALERDLDQQAGSLHQPDDITLLILERGAAEADNRPGV